MIPIGPLMVFLQGTTLTGEEYDLLQHPAIGGIIFFSRNYNNKEQLFNLISEVKNISPQLIFAVDHEGGRVQRFKEDFTLLPPMQLFGKLFEQESAQSLQLIYATGRLVSSELCEVGIHTGFSPVLDLIGLSEVIGDRALHAIPEIVIQLGREFVRGLSDGGLLAVGKHFPGHGTVSGDTHHKVVTDQRSWVEIKAHDLKVFQDLIADQTLQAVMPGHVIYAQVDSLPASRSEFWLKQVLRDQFGFEGVIFSDDLAMQGIRSDDGDVSAKCMLEAGCDMVLICQGLSTLQIALDELSDEDINRYANALGARWEHVDQQFKGKTVTRYFDADATREELQKLTKQFANN